MFVQKEILRREGGITLIALIITIIILVILAAVSINAAYNSGIVNYAVNGTQNYVEGTTKEKEALNTIESIMTSALGMNEDNPVIRGKTADELIQETEDISAYFGKYITNYVANTENGINYNNYNELVTNDEEKWQVFYIGDAGNGENQIYLISSNYINYDCMPLSPGGFAPYKSSNYTTNLNNVVNDYSNSNAVDSSTKYLNKMYFEYLEQNNKNSTNRNIKESAYMLDSGIWDVYANEYADFAIGGPTIELFFKSYNEKYNKEYKEQNGKEKFQVKVDSEAGYYRSMDGGSNWESTGPISNTDSLYCINSYTQSSGYFIASPGIWTSSLFNAFYDGHLPWHWNSDGETQGFRPLVCLNSDVRLEADGENYKIVEDAWQNKKKTKFIYKYTGSYQEFEATETGYYKIECYGARGGNNNWMGVFLPNYGLGGYAKGVIKLNKGEKLYLYVGGIGANGTAQANVLTKTSFNGGGAGIGSSDNNDGGGAGGGATDVRLVSGDWDNFDSLKSRIMVAGGGSGGATVASNFTSISGGSGGGLTAIGSIWKYSNVEVANHTYNATQTTGYKFGIGQNGITQGNAGGAGAGGGYYGGYSSTDSPAGGAGGGSGFISGYEGCNAISINSTENNIIHTNQSIHYSEKYFIDAELTANVSYRGKIIIEYLGQN